MSVARIYKVTNDVDDKVYIGGTTLTLARRMAVHRADGNNMLRTKPLSMHMREVGVSHFKIELISEVQFTDKNTLRQLEQQEIERWSQERLLNNIKAYVSDAGDRSEYHHLYDTELRDQDARRQQKRESYARMMANPEKAAKERERNRLRMQRNRCIDWTGVRVSKLITCHDRVRYSQAL